MKTLASLLLVAFLIAPSSTSAAGADAQGANNEVTSVSSKKAARKGHRHVKKPAIKPGRPHRTPHHTH